VACDTPSSDDARVIHEILKEKDIFDICPLLVTLTLEVGIYKWYMTHRLVMMHMSMKFHEILFIR